MAALTSELMQVSVVISGSEELKEAKNGAPSKGGKHWACVGGCKKKGGSQSHCEKKCKKRCILKGNCENIG